MAPAGTLLIIVGILSIVFRRWLAPRTQGSLGTRGETLRKVERSWETLGGLAVGFGVVLLIVGLVTAQ